MSLLRAVNVSVDTLDTVAGDLLALETEVTLGTAEPEHLRTELAAARRVLMKLTTFLHEERRLSR